MMDWIKQHAAASAAAAVGATAAGSVLVYVYVLPPQPADTPPKPEIQDELGQYPARFRLFYSGKIHTYGEWSSARREIIKENIIGHLSELCDITIKANGECKLLPDYDKKELGSNHDPRVIFRLHERDNRYAMIETYYHGTVKGVTWGQLESVGKELPHSDRRHKTRYGCKQHGRSRDVDERVVVHLEAA
ncbi:hypothetical protein [Magnetospirillum gryphiswaldense]|uniref:hypothetical protein n=1 Tax=Magnetospirillum gryphiswaldense TaxID=55518 RepID=UPI000D20264F|nr:hypothetical protein [Magnetospirillum gryphiswaldense]AVM72921.1 hypothetical protein MSR1_04090 [Magnetospirillum gryphiswaldense MSR-1]AVM76824.1 hypothetical protein MSR1L_04090 [Magnetospirillum gryphiswaldense]